MEALSSMVSDGLSAAMWAQCEESQQGRKTGRKMTLCTGRGRDNTQEPVAV